jgi:small-conductance mechanosensitive channel
MTLDGWIVTLLINVACGFFWFAFVRMTSRKLGNLLEAKFNPARNILFAWIHEISSDVKALGKGLAYLSLLSVPVGMEWQFLIASLLRILWCYFTIAAGVLIVAFLNVWEEWSVQNIPHDVSPRDAQFLRTCYPLVANTAKYAVYAIGIIIIFSIWDVNLSAILGGAAIFAVVFGFAGQALIADVIAGFMIVVERSYYAGSVVALISSEGNLIVFGTVLKFTWRVTHIREESGAIMLVSNRTIDRVRILKK